MRHKFTPIELAGNLSPDGKRGVRETGTAHNQGKVPDVLFRDGRTAGLTFNERYSDRSDSELRQLWSRQ